MYVQTSPFITWLCPQAQETADPAQPLEEWNRASFNRWRKLINQPQKNVGPRFDHGWYCISYEIVGRKRKIEPVCLPEILKSVVSRSNWPPFIYETHEEIKPYLIEGVFECWLGGDGESFFGPRSPTNSDFWRINPDGLAFLLRGFEEDGKNSQRPYEPVRKFNVTHSVSEIGEVLLHASRLALKLFYEPTKIKFTASYNGLEGRTLISYKRTILSPQTLVARQKKIMLTSLIDTHTIDSDLPNIVHNFLSPLCALFKFRRWKIELVQEGLEHIKEWGDCVP